MKKRAEFDQEEVLKSFAEGNELAFVRIFDRYYPKVFGIGLELFKSREMAKEVVQEVFIKLWERQTEFGHVRELEAFIYTMARNLALDMLKSQTREIKNCYKYSLSRDLAENSTENVVQTRDYEDLVNKEVGRLPRGQKQVYELSRIQGLTHQEIAEHLNISYTTVNKHLNRALTKLRKNLKPYFGSLIPVLLEILLKQQ